MEDTLLGRTIGLCSLLLIALVCAPALAGEVTMAFPQTVAELVDAGDGTITLELPEFAGLASPGDPALPYRDFCLLLPPNADTKTVRVDIRSGVWEELPEVYDVAPCPPMVSSNEERRIYWGQNKEIIDGRNVLTYGQDAFYPASHATLGAKSQLGEYVLATVRCWPYRYNPVTKKIVHLSAGEVVVSFSTSSSYPKVAGSGGAGAAQRLQDLVVNYEDAPVWYGSPLPGDRSIVGAANDRLVVVTTSAIKNASTKLNAFVTHKINTMNISTTVYTESDWGGSGLTGHEAVEKIRNWLKTLYNSQYRCYLLIIGDPRETSAVPMQGVWPNGLPGTGDYSYVHPTDYYYADLTGNWDANGDGYYGGPGDSPDLTAEFLVGRIPYYGSITELDKILQKIITFESATVVGSWAQKVLIPMVPTDENTPNWNLGEKIRETCAKNVYRPYYRLYADDYGVLPTPENCAVSEANVLNEWKKGYGYVLWFTHGWSQGASAVFSSGLCPQLPDAKPAFTWQSSCSNGYITDTNNLGYALLRNGAIATCSASELSWYWPQQSTFHDGGWSDQDLVYTYGLRMARDKWRCGDAKFNTVSRHGYDANAVVFNLYGDPTVSGRWPTTFTIESAKLPTPCKGSSYKVDLQAAGSTTPYRWSVVSGSLPPGLTIVASGTISGTPSVLGSYTFTVQCQTSSSPALTATKSYTLDVLGFAATSPLPRASLKVLYSHNLQPQGGTAPYTVATTSTLPGGMTLSSSGVLSGTPTETGTFSLAVTLTDAAGYVATATYSLTITALRIVETSIPIAVGGSSYSATLTADGGITPYTWALAAGALPPGLTFSGGVISGTPRELGNYSITVRVTDSNSETFTRVYALPALLPVYSFPLDTPPGPDPDDVWITQGSWAFGVPQGLGSLSQDPTSGHTGSNVYGYNLYGDYSNGMSLFRSLTTGKLDCGDVTHTALSFWRWLGVEGSGDGATVEASPDGVNWTVLWSAKALGATIADTDWQRQTYDISSVCDRKTEARLRWTMGPTDMVNRYCGWNIDDVDILGIPVASTVQGDIGLIRSTVADGTECLIRGKVVTAAFADCFYIQEPGSYQGLKVVWPYGGIATGRYILVSGIIQTDATTGERCLNAGCIYKDTSQAPTVRPVGMSLASLGGSVFGLQPGVADGSWSSNAGGQQILSYVPAVGVNNIGCLVRVTGSVTRVGSGYFYVDDGSELVDGTGLSNVGVRVEGNLTSQDVGKQAVVTGISTCFSMEGTLMRMIRPTQVYLISP